MNEQPREFSTPPLDLQSGSPLKLLKFFGPGAIVASVTIGSGETFFASRGGAIFGYGLIWCAILIPFLKGFQTYSGARYMVLTGEHPLRRWGQMPGPRGWFPFVMGALTIFSMPFWYAILSEMAGNIAAWSMGYPQSPESDFKNYSVLLGCVILVFAAIIIFLSSYRGLELAQMSFIVMLLACILVSAASCRPDWLELLKNLFWVHVPDYPDWLPSSEARSSPWVEVVTYFGAIGGGTLDYLGYLGFFREKGWGLVRKFSKAGTSEVSWSDNPIPLSTTKEQIARGKIWLRAPITDIVVASICVGLFTLAFMTLGAVILSPAHQVPGNINLLNYQATFLTRLSPALKYVYSLGVFMAIFGTIYGAFEIHTRTVYECALALFPRASSIPLRKFRLPVVIYCLIGGLSLILLSSKPPNELVQPAAILGSVFTCGLWCFAMIWTDRNFLPKAYQMKTWMKYLLLVVGIILTGFGVRAIYDYIGSFFM